MNPALLPVRRHLGQRLRRDLLAEVPPEVKAELPAYLTDALARVLAFRQVYRDRHPLGRGFDLVRFTPLDLALPWAGEA